MRTPTLRFPQGAIGGLHRLREQLQDADNRVARGALQTIVNRINLEFDHVKHAKMVRSHFRQGTVLFNTCNGASSGQPVPSSLDCLITESDLHIEKAPPVRTPYSGAVGIRAILLPSLITHEKESNIYGYPYLYTLSNAITHMGYFRYHRCFSP